jgi:hypothetical protein
LLVGRPNIVHGPDKFSVPWGRVGAEDRGVTGLPTSAECPRTQGNAPTRRTMVPL